MIKFSCKNCGQSIRVDDKHSGKRAKCPKCSRVIVVPGSSDNISFQCENCGQKIKVPKSYAGKKGKCPKCSNIVIIPAPEPVPAEPEVPSAPIPPNIDEDLYEEQSEEYEESEGMDRRLIFIISGVAAVVVVGIIILAVVLRSSGSSPVERYGIQDNQQQVVNRDLQPQPATADTQSSEMKAQELPQEDITSNEMVQPQGNIDDTKIAFWSDRDGKSNIYIMNPDGNGQRSISKSPIYGENLSRSPDGKKIVYTTSFSTSSVDMGIYVIDVDSGEQKNLTNTRLPYSNPSWSPDGKKIVFIKHGGIPEIYVMNADGSEQKNLTNDPGFDYDPCWSPDGKKIAFSTERNIGGVLHQDIYVMNADGSEQVNLTNSSVYFGSPGYIGLARDLCWSPDGKRIAFSSLGKICIVNTNGSGLKKLTNNNPARDRVSNRNPCWSPDGKKIAFTTEKNIITGGLHRDIYVMNADGSEQKNLTNNPASDINPCWSPDGKKIAFWSNRDGNGEIYIMNADGTDQKNLTNNPAKDLTQFSWSPFPPSKVQSKNETNPELQYKEVDDINMQSQPKVETQEATATSKVQASGYIDYVAELNKLGVAGRSESDNAAPLYQKAIELYVEVSPELEVLVSTEWPAELSPDEQRLLRQWVQSNSEALSQLEFAANKPYYWYQLSSPDIGDPSYLEGSVITALLPDLSYYRKLSQALLLRAKLSAAEGNFDQAITDIVTCYRVGLHLHTGGPKFLVEQLVGIAVRCLATRTAFAILDRTQLNENSLEGLQSQISQLSTNESYIFDFRSEKFSLLDIIQRIFTNDGNGDGQIDVTVAIPILRDAMSLSASVTSVNLEDEASSLQELRRRQTIETVEKSYQHIDTLFLKSQWQLNTENADWTKVAKENFIVATFFPAADGVSQMRDQCRAGTEALITTLAVLRHEADKGQLPEKIEDLVTSSYLQTLPSDPFSDKTLTYKRTDSGGFILYSFGRNLQDEGGEVGLSRSDGDAVFWPVRTGYYAF